MRLQTILISVLVLGFFVGGAVMWVNEGQATYDLNINTSLLENLDKINETYDLAVDGGQSLDQALEKEAQEGTTANTGLLGSIKTFYQSITIIPDLVTETATKFYVPEWMVYGFIAIILLVIALAILRLVGLIKGDVG